MKPTAIEEKQRIVIQYFLDHPTSTMEQIASATNVSKSSCQRYLTLPGYASLIVPSTGKTIEEQLKTKGGCEMIRSAYIHIPFCMSICSYCDFCKFYYNEDMVNKYLDALEKEIKDRYNGEVLNTIYIGGGTPSCLNIEELTRLFEILKVFKIDNLEYTIECNIENITEEKLVLFKKYGINRISIGIQTFNDKYIKYLNRNHTKNSAIETINLVKKYFDNINVDLIYALPKQTLEELENDIDIYLGLDISHISTYSLLIEPHTMLYNNNEENIDENLDYEMYKLICNKLSDYEHYETSNFGKIKSRHNLVYWNNDEYYGFGMGASGYINSIRYDNTKSFNEYIKGNYVKEEVYQTDKMKMENEFILGLRKMNGIDINRFKERYNIDIKSVKGVNELIESKQLVLTENNLSIHPDYWYLANTILINFID